MANTYVKIGSTVTVGSGGAASIDFTSIPATYTNLIVKVCARTDRASINDIMLLAFNGSTSSFTSRYLEGNGASAGSYTDQPRGFGNAAGSLATSSTFGNSELYIPNYAGSTNKSYSGDGVEENNATTAFSSLFAGLWSNAAAINQITIYGNGSNFVQYSTASLYGILKS
jgi:hypothetical protein